MLDVQAGLLDHLLPRDAAPAPIRNLNPVFEVAGTPHVMPTQAIAAVPLRNLRAPIGALRHRQDDITRALDVVLSGF